MFKLYSERQRDKNGEPEVYIYDSFSSAFRTQLFLIISDVLSRIRSFSNRAIWTELHNVFCREKGIKSLGSVEADAYDDFRAKHNFEEYIDAATDMDLLDIIDFVFRVFYNIYRGSFGHNSLIGIDETIDKAIAELNRRFEQHRLGYEFTNGEITRIDNKVVHKEFIKPAINLLCTEGFEGAEAEYMKAFEARLQGDNKTAIVEAEKAFESAMKTICLKRGFAFDQEKDSAKKLISILKDNNFFPGYMEDHLNTVAKALENGAPTVRNKTSGHGQGEEIVEVPNSYAEYVIGLVAVNMVLLVKIFKGE